MAHINVTGEVDYMHNWKDVANDDVLVSVAYLHRPKPLLLTKGAMQARRCCSGGFTLAEYLQALVSLPPREDLADPRPKLG